MLDREDHEAITRHLREEERREREAARDELHERRRRRLSSIVGALRYVVADAVRDGSVTTREEAVAQIIDALADDGELDQDDDYELTELGPITEAEVSNVVEHHVALPDDHGTIRGIRSASGWRVEILDAERGRVLWSGEHDTLDGALREACARSCEAASCLAR